MLFSDVIRKKRDGGTLSADELRFFVAGLVDGSLPPEQVAALAMAVCLRSMTFAETAELTLAMAASGQQLDWRSDDLGGPVVDKHSTGGVGDKVSLILAPLAAACGMFVPMISGRGLGHSGGTLDKLESIPGYCTQPDMDRFRRAVAQLGCAIIGQTAELAPADRYLYAIRDVTATVESIPLITASILSKKMAAGNDALVMDVKTGSGAFMTTLKDSRALAESLIGTAARTGLVTHALITDMNECLGSTAGNAVEVAEAVAYLTNERREARLHEVVVALAGEMLLVGGLVTDRQAGRERAEQVLASGAAAERFGRMVTALGGPADFIERAGTYLPRAPHRVAVAPAAEGYLARVDGRALGNAVVALGGGRRRIDDPLDLSVGFTDLAAIGTRVDGARPLGIAHAATPAAADRAALQLREACAVSAEPPAHRPLIYQVIGAAAPS
jgi:thymidine phosphorylase